jgi:Flp pilus assembly protein TadD
MLAKIASRFSPPDDSRNIIQALRFMRRAAELDTVNVSIMTDNGAVLHYLDQIDSAGFWCERALKTEPDNLELQANLKSLRELADADSLTSKAPAIDSLQ